MRCSTHRILPGRRSRSPVDPLALALLGIEPTQSHQTVSPVLNHSQGSLRRSPAPHRLGGRSCPHDPRPLHGDNFIESKGRSCPCAILTTTGAIALPFLGTIPSIKGVSRPWNPDQPCAAWMPKNYRSRLNPHLICPLNPAPWATKMPFQPVLEISHFLLYFPTLVDFSRGL